MKDGLYFARHPAHNHASNIQYPFIILVYNERPVYVLSKDSVTRLPEENRLDYYDLGPAVSHLDIHKAFPTAQFETKDLYAS